jgi:ribosomal-protein-alanine N-acetyltransferase
MTIRDYTAKDKAACVAVFKSNCPKFFDESELDLFIKWLDHQVNQNSGYQSPTYTNSEKDAYSVIETPENGIVACGGFYIITKSNEARLAWGMVHNDFHKHGYGKILYEHRYKKIKAGWPDRIITLGTSQHTYPFYEKMGMKVIASFKQGYGPDLDRYDMQQQ